MKKWLISLVILLLLGFGFAKLKVSTLEEWYRELTGPAEQNDQMLEPETFTKELGFTIEVSKSMIYEGDLLLVNKDYPVPEGLHPETEAVSLVKNPELIDGFGVLDNSIMLSPRLVEHFTAMVKAAGKEGIHHFLISSGYRDESKQEELYREMGPKWALPAGFSEHNLGLSLDIGSSQGEMSEAPEGLWLKQHAWEYGFILRYPEDKTDITGIRFEPWHFRYVGQPHSTIMQEEGLVLEQYLDELKKRKSMSATVGGQKYRVFYYPVSEDQVIYIPVQGKYSLSGNNIDGIIVTVAE